jgi:hypothetical protein
LAGYAALRQSARVIGPHSRIEGEAGLKWGKIAKHAVALFLVQFVIGLVEGLLTPEASSSVRAFGVSLIVASFVSFAACAAVFAHLSARQPVRPYAHAWFVLFFQLCAAGVLWLALPDWLHEQDPVLFVLVD